MAFIIAGLRGGRAPSLPVLGYILLCLYLAFFIEAALFLKPFQLANEYSACQRITETGWILLVALVFIFHREEREDISMFEIRILPFLSYLGLLFAMIYVIIPIIAYTTSSRMSEADFTQGIGTRENAERQSRAITSRIASAASLADLNQVPGLVAAIPAGVDRSDLAAVKKALTAVTARRTSDVINQNLGEIKGRQFIRNTQTNRLIAQCVFVVIGCLWVWMRTKSLKIDVDLELAN
jgi:hypothetical protein